MRPLPELWLYVYRVGLENIGVVFDRPCPCHGLMMARLIDARVGMRNALIVETSRRFRTVAQGLAWAQDLTLRIVLAVDAVRN